MMIHQNRYQNFIRSRVTYGMVILLRQRYNNTWSDFMNQKSSQKYKFLNTKLYILVHILYIIHVRDFLLMWVMVIVLFQWFLMQKYYTKSLEQTLWLWCDGWMMFNLFYFLLKFVSSNCSSYNRIIISISCQSESESDS